MTADRETVSLLAQLRKEIDNRNYRYYVLDDPGVSDVEFDDLMSRLRDIEGRFPDLITPDSPSQRVGAIPKESFPEVHHKVPMLSLANSFSKDEFRAWYSRSKDLLSGANFDMMCELKIDGLAVSITYDKGILHYGATRGNGIVGEDVTANLRTIRSLPLSVPKILGRGSFEVRGEAYLPIGTFERLNNERIARGDTPFSNTRNTAAGTLRQLDPDIAYQRQLDIFIYGLGWVKDAAVPSKHSEIMGSIKEMGFKVNPYNRVLRHPEEVEEHFDEWVARHGSLNYDTDGIVVKVNSIDYQNVMGTISREPRWAIAIKWPTQKAITQLLNIRINVGRTGSLNPYAELSPVKLRGVEIRRATLHNEQDIHKKDIRVGDWVMVERAGDVIPKVIGPVIERRSGAERVFAMPNKCPVCQGDVVREPGKAALYCTNIACPAQLFRLMSHFAQKNAMNIDGLGPEWLSKLLEKGFIRNIADIYEINAEELLQLEGMGEKLASNILSSIENSKDRPLANLLFSLGIAHVGIDVSKLLMGRFSGISELGSASYEEIIDIDGIGPVIASGVKKFFERPLTNLILDKLRKSGLNLEEHRTELFVSGDFSGKRFCFTGKLDSFSRSQAEDMVNAVGGIMTSSVTNETDYLVVGSKPGRKLEDAKKLDVDVINQSEFLGMISTDARI